MSENINIEVRNTLITEKRDLNIYHHATRSAYMISHNNVITIPLGTVENGDYLHISAVSGPGSLEKECWFDIPAWCDFTVTALGNGDLIHSGDRTMLMLPSGPTAWQLKIKRPAGQAKSQTHDYIAIGDREYKIRKKTRYQSLNVIK